MCLNYQELENSISDESNYLSVLEADENNPNYCGVYAIRIKDLNKLPLEIVKYQQSDALNPNIIYIGMANPAFLSERLIGNDLNNSRPAIFFRKLGSVLSKVAEPYTGKNYQFNRNDEDQIIHWIKENLSVKYFKYPIDEFSDKETANNYEKPLIQTFAPAFNYQHNPYKCQYITDLHRNNLRIGKTK